MLVEHECVSKGIGMRQAETWVYSQRLGRKQQIFTSWDMESMAILGVLLFAEVGHWGNKITSLPCGRENIVAVAQTSDKGKKLLKKFPQLA